MHINRLFRFLKAFLLSVAILFALIILGINLPFSQRLITAKANRIFQDKGLPVHIEKATLLVNGRIGVNNVRIVKDRGDTIIFVQRIRIAIQPFPLLFKRVKVKDVRIEDAVVNLSTDTLSGRMNLISLFSTDAKTQEIQKKPKKKWDIQIKSANLKNIRFSYDDARHGIRIDQSVEKLSVGFDKFSLITRQLYAAFIDMEEVHGGVTLKPSSHEKSDQNKPPVAWKFKLNQSDLRNILFILQQPDHNRRMEFSLGRGDISNASLSLEDKRITVTRLMLRDPGALLFSSPAPKKPESTSTDTSGNDFPGLWNITGDHIIIRNGSYHTSAYPGLLQLDPENASLQIATLTSVLKDVRLSRQESGFTMNRLSFGMENGFQLDKGKIVFRSDSTLKSLLKVNLTTASSRMNLNIEAGNELAALIRSYHTVPFSLNIKDTEISARDLLFFLPHLKEQYLQSAQKNFRLGVNCTVAGTSDLLRIGNFSLNTTSGDTLSVSGQMTGITKPSSALCSVAFRTGAITRSRLSELMQMTGSSVNLPDFAPLTIQGRLDKSLIAPDFFLSLQGRSGNIALNGSMDLPEKSTILKMTFSGLELGELSGISDLDRLSGSLDLTGKEFIPDSMKIKASVIIDSAGYRGYLYQGIRMELNGDRGLYAFGVNASDPSFNCDLTGTVDLNDSLTKGQLSGMFNLDAGRLHLYKDISVRGALEASLSRTPGDLNAAVSLKNLVLSKDQNAEDLKDFSLTFHSSGSLVTGKVEADFLRADMHCAGSLGDLKRAFSAGRFKGVLLVDSAMENKIPYVSVLPDMVVSIESTYDPFIGLLLNDSIFSYHKVAIKLVIDTSGFARAEMLVDKFNFGMSSGYAATVHLEGSPDKTVLRVKADSMRYGEISLADMAIDMKIAGDTGHYRLKASDKAGRLLYDLAGVAYQSDWHLKLRSTQSQWILNGFAWTVSPGEFLVLESDKKDFTADLHWKNDGHAIDFYGRKSDKIYFDCRNVGLSMLLIPGMNTFGYDGELTGKIYYQGGNTNELGIQMDVRKLKQADQLIGNLKISGSYLSDTLGTIESDIKTVLNDTSRLDLIVRYGKKAGHKSIRTNFSAIPLNIFESLVSKYISGLHGEMSGELAFTSTGNKPQLKGSIQINKTALKVVSLNAPFYVPGDSIKLENNQLIFRQFTVLDSLKKRLNLNGTVDLNDPGNITADLQITSDRFQVMNTTEKDNPAFNGTVFVNSKLNITGPVQKPSITGNIVLAGGTVINYRYTEDLTVSETEKTITFASLTKDTSARDVKLISVSTFSKAPNIEASIEIDPNSLFNFQISRGFDIGVQITGGGFLNYALMPNKAVHLNGTYEIQQGSSHLKLPGWPRKDFVITPGSYLKWNGAVDDPELRLETTSKVRGSYYNPVDGKDRQVDFKVFMKLTNRLSQLEIGFDVGSNDQYITSVFNTLSSDERMRQAINLLIFERIELPNMSSSSDYVSQQINQFWESQLNQITKSAIKNVDLSFGIDTYTGTSEGGGEQEYTSFTYEVKKEMFNDRGSVLVSGRMNDNSQAGAPTNNVIENFIFEYALDTNRSKYLKVYRQQNYEDLLEGEVTKSGVGFIYRKSYDKLREIWRRKEPRAKNQEARGKTQDK